MTLEKALARLKSLPPVKYVDLPNHVRLPYVEQGDPPGTPLLLLHGLTDSWRSFELVLPHLPDSVHAFAITQRGHGDASHPATGYRARDFADDLVLFVAALDLGRVVLVGHSSHTFVVERFARDHPELALGLVLIGAPFTLRGRPGVAALLSSVSELSDPIDPEFVRRFAEGTIHRSVPKAFLEAMVQESLKVPSAVWKEAFFGLLESDAAEEMARITVPTLIVWGDRDTIVSREDQEAIADAIASSSLLVYPGTGHTPHWEEPARVASDLAAFVESLTRQAIPNNWPGHGSA